MKIIELNELVTLFNIIFYHEGHELNKLLAFKTDCVLIFYTLLVFNSSI